MDNKSILDQIIINHQAEEVAHLDAIELISNLFNELNNRERDVLARRFGLFGNNKETLEKIGQTHKLTRERIRQIETSSIKKIKQFENLYKHISGLKKVINQLLEEHGGLMEKEYMFDNLVNSSVGACQKKDEDADAHRRHFDFLISKLLSDEFEVINKSKHFKDSFKLKYQSLEHLESLVEELLEKIKQAKKIMMTDELMNLTKELANYKNNEEKFKMPNNMDISSVLANDLFSEKADLINANKVVYSLFKAIRDIKQNSFGYWGISDWREIKPRTINDKIYIVLKNHGKPMHFVEIANRINQVGFDKKKANAATVHNELILDNRYILVGRGSYGLKEWGYSKGAVIDVIEDLLRSTDKPLSRDEIIAKVLEQRTVRKATVSLSLMDKKKFERLKDGKYQLKSVK
ncbi:MAG: sigma factor-like helix-turn-helix DNA-binding protein [Patescibacteria group bacterium]